MTLVDTHCHLHREEFDADRGEVVRRAQEAGVHFLLDPATDFASNRKVVALAKEHSQVYAAIGLHPHDAAQLSPQALEELTSLATESKVVAVGEIGLDYYRLPAGQAGNLSPREVQQETLRKLLLLAHEMHLPIILHCRDGETASTGDAYRDLFRILQEVLKPPIRGLLHCFAGSIEIAHEALDLGLYLSFAANLMYPKAEALRAVAKAVPFDKVLLETDAPFLAPQSHRGKRNEPAYLSELAQAWASLLDFTLEDVARVTSVNAYHLFGIGTAPAKGKIAYAIGKSLYLNPTNACTDRCIFCALSVEEFWKGEGVAPFVKGHHLRMERDPSVEEMVDAVGDPAPYQEVVLCGYGEPIIKLGAILEVAKRLKAKGARWVRLNTNGHGNLIHKRSVAPELKGWIDEVSVSLNTPNAQQYLEICRPAFGLPTYDSIKDFIRECRDAGLKVVATAVAMPGVDLPACQKVATDELKVPFRARTYNDLG